jgi:hypothetical protein
MKCDSLHGQDGWISLQMAVEAYYEVPTAVPGSLLALLLDPVNGDVPPKRRALRYTALLSTAVTTSNPKHNYSTVGAQNIEKLV